MPLIRIGRLHHHHHDVVLEPMIERGDILGSNLLQVEDDLEHAHHRHHGLGHEIRRELRHDFRHVPGVERDYEERHGYHHHHHENNATRVILWAVRFCTLVGTLLVQTVVALITPLLVAIGGIGRSIERSEIEDERYRRSHRHRYEY